MNLRLHNDIKPLLANLNRLDFDEYFETSEFKNILLENGDDYLWNEVQKEAKISDYESENLVFASCLHYMLELWLENNDNATALHFNRFAKYIIFGYLDFNEDEGKNFDKLLKSLDFAPITKETIKQIQNKIKDKEYTQVKMINEKSNELNATIFDYAIIAALEDDEMEKILNVATIEKEIENNKYFLRQGYFNSNPNKKILFFSQNFTGFVDSAILATEIISKYKVKLIIMPGVLGGNPTKTNFGDVIIATKVFTIDKGKIEKDAVHFEIESSNINNNYISKIKAKKKHLIDYIRDQHTENKIVNIFFEPIACVRQVINKEGYFKENILSLERKAMGIEMESYGVVRAAELANYGKTDVLIIKSVMDKTEEKGDNYKTLASFTSATVVEYLFKENLV